MGTILRQNNRTIFAISMIAALFTLTAACGGSSTNSPGQTPVPTVVQANSPTAAAVTPVLPDEAPGETPSISTSTPPTVAAQSTDPVLINTPVPVANLAPDFTLPSIQGTEYTLSDFRGEQPVLVVFYRAYW